MLEDLPKGEGDDAMSGHDRYIVFRKIKERLAFQKRRLRLEDVEVTLVDEKGAAAPPPAAAAAPLVTPHVQEVHVAPHAERKPKSSGVCALL